MHKNWTTRKRKFNEPPRIITRNESMTSKQVLKKILNFFASRAIFRTYHSGRRTLLLHRTLCCSLSFADGTGTRKWNHPFHKRVLSTYRTETALDNGTRHFQDGQLNNTILSNTSSSNKRLRLEDHKYLSLYRLLRNWRVFFFFNCDWMYVVYSE